MTDEKHGGHSEREWIQGIANNLKRQIAELEETKEELHDWHASKPIPARKPLTADDDPELLGVVLELRALRQMATELENELRGESTDERQNP